MQVSTTTSRTAALASSPRIADTLDSFAADMAGGKGRPRTIDTYVRAVHTVAAWLGDESAVANLTADAIGRYQIGHAHLAAATLSKHLSAIRAYCRWCKRARLRADDPTDGISWPKKRKKIPRALKSDELRALEAILDRRPPLLDKRAGRIWRRNRRIVILLVYTGLRRTEVSNVVWGDIDLEAETLIVGEASAKGGHERIVSLHPRVLSDLKTTPAKQRRGAVAGHMDGRCLSHKTIGHVFDRWLSDAGLHISAHRLRHTCASLMLRHGANIKEIQRQLGHQDIRTTERYLDLADDQQHRAVRLLPDRLA